jgi:hypothetical protein
MTPIYRAYWVANIATEIFPSSAKSKKEGLAHGQPLIYST